jgi:hypothetical protein
MNVTYAPSNKDRMFCYLWWEKTNPVECKFGERWVPAGQDPEKKVWKRIKESLGVRKDIIRDGIVVLESIWDVSELAKSSKVDRFYKQSRMDDFIRPAIGHRKGTTGEIHTLSANDVAIKVNQFLAKNDQPLPVAGLSQNQYTAAENVIEAIANGKSTIVAELCARFGKTIWSGAIICETGASLTIVASYVLTVFTSFKKDLTSFEQFRDLVLVDTADKDYQLQILNGLNQGKQVVAFLSMCSGSHRQDKINFLFSRKTWALPRLLLIDEADFGVHKKTQSEPLIDAKHETDATILMTGTNGDKAASIWSVEHYLSVTYPELLMEKHKRRLVN